MGFFPSFPLPLRTPLPFALSVVSVAMINPVLSGEMTPCPLEPQRNACSTRDSVSYPAHPRNFSGVGFRLLSLASRGAEIPHFTDCRAVYNGANGHAHAPPGRADETQPPH